MDGDTRDIEGEVWKVIPNYSLYMCSSKGRLKTFNWKNTVREVLEIRSKFKPRVITRKILGEEYGVSPCTIKDIIARRSWKHI